MVLGPSEGRASLHVSFKELVCEMLSKEGKHETGALWVRDKLPSEQELFHQNLHIRQFFFSCKSRDTGFEAITCSMAKDTQIHATESVSKPLSLLSGTF